LKSEKSGTATIQMQRGRKKEQTISVEFRSAREKKRRAEKGVVKSGPAPQWSYNAVDSKDAGRDGPHRYSKSSSPAALETAPTKWRG